MTALTTGRDTKERDGKKRNFPVAATALMWQGGIAVLNANGYLTKAITATGLKAVGVNLHKVDNSTGANGAINATVERGVFGPFANSASTDQITAVDIENACYIVDDQTVAKTSGTNTRSVAGIVHDVDASGVWVRF